MNILLFFAASGIILGITAAFYLVTKQMQDSNEIGNTKGDHLDYSSSFYLINAKDNVPRSLDIDEMS